MKLQIKIVLGLVFIIGMIISFYYLPSLINSSQKNLDEDKEFRDLCERNNGHFLNNHVTMPSCYVINGDFLDIYQFSRNPDGKTLKLFRIYE